MSQAHYTTCRSADWRGECGAAAVALVWLAPSVVSPRCVEHLNDLLDFRDMTRLPEPLKIEWVWDAGTRTCLLHHWPDVLCAGWTDEHKRLVSALKTST